MAYKALAVAFSMIAAMTPVSAASPEQDTTAGAPAGGPDTKYCLRVELTGSNIDSVRCWTREKWAEQGVDVDKEWAREGVAVKG